MPIIVNGVEIDEVVYLTKPNNDYLYFIENDITEINYRNKLVFNNQQIDKIFLNNDFRFYNGDNTFIYAEDTASMFESNPSLKYVASLNDDTYYILRSYSYSSLSNKYIIDKNLIGKIYFNRTMASTYWNSNIEEVDVDNLPFSINHTLNMAGTFADCHNLKKAICGSNVINMIRTYWNCYNLTEPVCGDNVRLMAYTYSRSGVQNAICGPNVTNMFYTYNDCHNLTGSPVCGDNVRFMRGTYSECYHLTGSPVCGSNVEDMYETYCYCNELTGSPVCGDKVTDIRRTYYGCDNLTGNPVCGDNVTDMDYAYDGCYSLTGSAACGPNVVVMNYAYYGCSGLERAACGDNVEAMYYAYSYCNGLIEAACGKNVKYMAGAYRGCSSLSAPVAGPNVIDMSDAYSGCAGLNGEPAFAPNVIDMSRTYSGAHNIYGNLYLMRMRGNVSAVQCFWGRNAANMLNIFVKPYSSWNAWLYENGKLLGYEKLQWTAIDNGYYNETSNIYVYYNLGSEEE